MSSRARRVPGQAEPFNWAAAQTAPRGQADAERAAPDPQHEQRIVALERDAFAKGYAQGERAGAEVAGQRAETMLRRLGQTIEELASIRHEIMRGTEQQIVQLSMAIAQRVIGREIEGDRSLLVAMARIALDRLGEHASATIRLHPDDYQVVMAARQPGPDDALITIVADSVVGRGGCLVQSDFGLMDVGLESQFRELTRSLLGDRETEPSLKLAR